VSQAERETASGVPARDGPVSNIQAGPYSLRGVSVGGVYTSLQVPELSVVLDAGITLRALCGTDNLFLSHGHIDHVGGLFGLLGVRGLMQKPNPLRVYLPQEIAADLVDALTVTSRLQRFPLQIEAIALAPGDARCVANNLWVRAFRTHHPVPSLGYQFVRRVKKLKPAYKALSGPEIAEAKRAEIDLFDDVEHLELCYATDTLIRVLDTNPSMLHSRVLVLECTFYDERKSLADSRAGCHIHLDELLEAADRFENEHLVLMHVSQIYSAREAREILQRRCPPALLSRITLFGPERGPWL
jgi:ribonuclease Z